VAALFECVPNVSEGRDAAVVEACAAAIEGAGALLAHRTSDPIHNRTVFTFFGTREEVSRAALALAEVTTARIDLRRHRGAHPRIGALDVLPFVPLGTSRMSEAVELARETALQIWERTGVPTMFYGAAATRPARQLLADVRAGQFEGLIAAQHSTGPPDIGDVRAHPSAGSVAVGARPILIAFNVVLTGGDLRAAQEIARALRERSGGLRSVRALGIALGAEHVQVSCNLTDPVAVPLYRVFEFIRRRAARRGIPIERSETIGLLPRAALEAVAARALGIDASVLRQA
jgi:glutamate formiminotransferase